MHGFHFVTPALAVQYIRNGWFVEFGLGAPEMKPFNFRLSKLDSKL